MVNSFLNCHKEWALSLNLSHSYGLKITISHIVIIWRVMLKHGLCASAREKEWHREERETDRQTEGGEEHHRIQIKPLTRNLHWDTHWRKINSCLRIKSSYGRKNNMIFYLAGLVQITFYLKQTNEKKLEWNRAIHLMFVYIRKVYNHIPISKLCKCSNILISITHSWKLFKVYIKISKRLWK